MIGLAISSVSVVPMPEVNSSPRKLTAPRGLFETVSYEKVVAGKNLEYVIEVLRTDGQSPWFACSHDEFVIQMDGEVRIEFIRLDTPPQAGRGTVSAGTQPAGRKMGYVVLRQGHQALLPAGCAYRFTASRPGVALVQTVLGELSVEKWADICLH
nr:hydroxyquinol 1,2-dioxygenase [Burkholderia contaminans]